MESELTKKEFTAPYVISFITELIGSAIMIFMGCMGCIMGFDLGPVIPSFSFAFSVMMPIQIFAHISPVHMNPGVSIGFVILGLMEWKRFLVYVFAQYIGCFCGYGLLKLVTTYLEGMCKLHLKYGINVAQGFFMEYLSSFILFLVVCGAIDRKNATLKDSFCLRLGFTICGIVFALETFTGAGLNSARSLPPVIFDMDFTDHWLYEVAPNLGMATAAVIYRFVLDANESKSFHSFLLKKFKTHEIDQL
ncbi:unnamed protein product [Phaedon cochleariae]|uniref:Aquaporin n=1 Tax=Phaedon cochleariae TaxID=80249 RepID=A0A9P0DYB7_PHACE|nr:unnamed protein product [Phaedon cochleariae]